MNLIGAMRRNAHLTFVLGFLGACIIGFGYLWVGSGGHIPIVAEGPAYSVSFQTNDLRNLLDDGDVKIAGVVVGHVQSRRVAHGGADVTFTLDDSAAPLHQGVKIQVDVKSLVGTSYVSITDGSGPAIPNHALLTGNQVVPAVDVDQLLSTLDAPTRAHLQSAVQSLAVATKQTGTPLNQVMTGLGQVATSGRTVLAALRAQSVQLQSLTGTGRTLLDQLDVGQGQIAQLVTDAQTLTSATANRGAELRSAVRQLPALISSVQGGTTSLQQLVAPLGHVTTALRAAAPDLNHALLQLPSTTSDLSSLVPSLNQTLVELPATLSRVSAFDKTVQTVIPTARVSLSDVNPMLTYLAPYGLDLGALFGNFGGSFDQVAEDGIMPIRLTAIAEGVTTVRNIPIKLPNLTTWMNPYPKPGAVGSPTPFEGKYPHVDRAAQ